MSSFETHLRRAGILLHPTSLPSGILDDDVERWLQLLSDTGFNVWQVLPLGEPQSGPSPYQCTSAFAFNPLLLPDYPAVDSSDSEYKSFCNKQQFWLDDYVLFTVLKQHFGDCAWNGWPDEWKLRESESLQQTWKDHEPVLTELKWQQYQLHKRWHEIRDKAAMLGIVLFGDMPIFIAQDSADVWAHPEWFLLDKDGNMEVVTGVPPDYFSETGQRWGNPHYDWETMEDDDFAWWKSRIDHHLELFDLVRIDHFRGLEAAWFIDASCDTAIDGHWQKIPGDKLLMSLQTSLENCHEQLPFVAEDLGVITPEVTALRKKYHLPGMSILQFGFDEFDDNPHKLKNIVEDMVVYTGTHDNDTTKGWFNSLDEYVKKQVLKSLKLNVDDVEAFDQLSDIIDPMAAEPELADYVVEKMIADAMRSRAVICIIPMQDCLHLGNEARMNVPGTITGNWQWQFRWHQVEQQYDDNRIGKMRSLIEKSHRLVTVN
jgi:4-alpha-glucanotransferase